ncbi:MAG: hypothetical protein M1608_12690 [Candidatus Omnitrophica bacterium]|nr:hypothetical protein [Candidatus Omnitrophota bacterium]
MDMLTAARATGGTVCKKETDCRRARMAWEPGMEELLQRFCHSLFHPDSKVIALIAGNNDQVIESFRRLKETEDVKRARQVFEDLLVEDRQEQNGVRLKFFNSSRSGSAELLDRAMEAFLGHP